MTALPAPFQNGDAHMATKLLGLPQKVNAAEGAGRSPTDDDNPPSVPQGNAVLHLHVLTLHSTFGWAAPALGRPSVCRSDDSFPPTALRVR